MVCLEKRYPKAYFAPIEIEEQKKVEAYMEGMVRFKFNCLH